MSTKKSFVVACKTFFGMRSEPFNTLPEFKKEINELTNKDRREIATGLTENGFEIDETTIESANAPS